MLEILLLRLIHVVGGMVWVGAGVFTTAFLMPALSGLGPTAGAVMEGLQQRRLFLMLPMVAILTILSGLRLMWITSGGFTPAYFATTRGAAFAGSGGAAIVAFFLAMFVSRPAAVRAAALGAELGRAQDEAARASLVERMTRLRRRSTTSSRIVTALVLLAAAGMAVARYLR